MREKLLLHLSAIIGKVYILRMYFSAQSNYHYIEGSTVAIDIFFSMLSYRYIFPGLALGASLGQTGVITNAMINRSAEALVELISDDDLERRATFPENHDIREISLHLALRVIQQALDENLKVILISYVKCYTVRIFDTFFIIQVISFQ